MNSSETDVLVSGLNPMEFIDVGVSPTNDMDDDVFVNLDAFDMLGDFPELEVLENSNNGNLALILVCIHILHICYDDYVLISLNVFFV